MTLRPILIPRSNLWLLDVLFSRCININNITKIMLVLTIMILMMTIMMTMMTNLMLQHQRRVQSSTNHSIDHGASSN